MEIAIFPSDHWDLAEGSRLALPETIFFDDGNGLAPSKRQSHPGVGWGALAANGWSRAETKLIFDALLTAAATAGQKKTQCTVLEDPTDSWHLVGVAPGNVSPQRG
jgi:hypothetical protein